MPCHTHPATGKSPFELMFGRKMRLGLLPEISETPESDNHPEVRQNDVLYKLKSKLKKVRIAVGNKILMKNKRTDPLSPIPGKVIKMYGNAMTGKFLCGTSHISRLYERDLASRNEKEYEEKKRLKTTYSTEEESIRVRETSCRTRLILTKQMS